jgi:hypothetical protein
MMLKPVLLAVLFIVGGALVVADENPPTADSPAVTNPSDSTSEASISAPAIESSNATTDAPADAALPKWVLQYKFQPELKLHYRTTEKKTLQGEIDGNRKVDVSELRMGRVFTVQSVDTDGTAQIAMQFDEVWMSRKVNDDPAVEFDARMKPSEIPNEFRNVAHSLKGGATRYAITSRGLPADRLMEPPAVDNSPPAGKTVDQAVLVEPDSTEGRVTTIAATATPGSRKQDQTTSFLMPLPEHPVAVGDRWKETIPVTIRVTAEFNREVNILRTYRLESVENGIANISFWSSIASPVKGPTMMSQLIQATPRGTMMFDIERGAMTRREMRYDQSVPGVFGSGSLLTSIGTTVEELQPAASNQDQ